MLWTRCIERVRERTDTYTTVGGNPEGNSPFRRLLDLFAVRISKFTSSDDWIIVNNESKMMPREVVVT